MARSRHSQEGFMVLFSVFARRVYLYLLHSHSLGTAMRLWRMLRMLLEVQEVIRTSLLQVYQPHCVVCAIPVRGVRLVFPGKVWNNSNWSGLDW